MQKRDSFFLKMVKLMIAIIVSFNTIMLCIFSVLVVIGILVAILFWSGPTSTFQYTTESGDHLASNKILSVKVNGLILGDNTEADLFGFLSQGVTYGYEVKQELMEAVNDPNIKGVIVEINSPGGTIYGSRAIADGISYYRTKTGNPVSVFISGLAASGGYMAGVTADSMYADHGSTIGSIGVILGPIKYYDGVVSEGGLLQGEVVTENGIESTFITAGKSKDMGNPYRRLTREEQDALQQMVNSEYQGFVSFVSQHRKINRDTLVNSVGALIYDNATATRYNLIDGTKNQQQAVEAVAKKAGVLSDYQVVGKITELGFFEYLFGAQAFYKKPQTTASSCVPTQGVLAYHGDLNIFCGSVYSK